MRLATHQRQDVNKVIHKILGWLGSTWRNRRPGWSCPSRHAHRGART